VEGSEKLGKEGPRKINKGRGYYGTRSHRGEKHGEREVRMGFISRSVFVQKRNEEGEKEISGMTNIMPKIFAKGRGTIGEQFEILQILEKRKRSEEKGKSREKGGGRPILREKRKRSPT